MKIRTGVKFNILLLTVLLSGSCRTEFEKLRTSTDAERIYEKAIEYYDDEEYQKAQTLFEIILNSFRGTAKAEDLYFKHAYTYYYLNNFILAAHYFETFSNTFTSSAKREDADFLRAYCNYNLSPGYRLDQEYTQNAIELFQLFINTYPNSDRVEECNSLIDSMRKKLEEKTYEQGKLYYDLQNYGSAIHTFENLLKDFPETKHAEEIRFLILKGAFLLAENSFVQFQQERYQSAADKYYDFIRKFPNSMYKSEVDNIFDIIQDKIKLFANE